MSDLDALDAEIRAAQSRRDLKRLWEIYYELGQEELAQNNINEGCFFLVQAYVYALEDGAKIASEIHGLLKAHGREE